MGHAVMPGHAPPPDADVPAAWHALAEGTVVTGPWRRVTEELVDALVSMGGFTHPLFTDPAFLVESPFSSRPLPGTAALHLLAGMAEQCGVLDETVIGLVGFDAVQLHVPLLVGDELRLRLTRLTAQPTRRADRVVLRTRWEGLRLSHDGGEDDVAVAAVAVFLARLPA